jgi:hypothetical protein
MERAELCAGPVAATHIRRCSKIIFISACVYILLWYMIWYDMIYDMIWYDMIW